MIDPETGEEFVFEDEDPEDVDVNYIDDQEVVQMDDSDGEDWMEDEDELMTDAKKTKKAAKKAAQKIEEEEEMVDIVDELP